MQILLLLPVPCCMPTLLSCSRQCKSWSRAKGTANAGNIWWRCRKLSSPVLDRLCRRTVAVTHQTDSLPVRLDPGRFHRTPSVPIVQVYPLNYSLRLSVYARKVWIICKFRPQYISITSVTQFRPIFILFMHCVIILIIIFICTCLLYL